MPNQISYKTSYQTNLSFGAQFDCPSPLFVSAFSILGICSGAESGLSFSMSGSRIYDHKNRFVYSYASGDRMGISGNLVSGNSFNYFIDNSPFYADDLGDFIVTGFAFSSASNVDSFYLNIYGEIPQYRFDYATDTAKSSNLIRLTNLAGSGVNFDITGASIMPSFSNLGYVSISGLDSLPLTISGQEYIDFGLIFSSYLEDRVLSIPLSIQTTFGKIEENFYFNRLVSGSTNIIRSIESSGLSSDGQNSNLGIVMSFLADKTSNQASLLIDDIFFTGAAPLDLAYSGQSNGLDMPFVSGSTNSGMFYSGQRPAALYSSIYSKLFFDIASTGFPITGGFRYSALISSGIETGNVNIEIYNNQDYSIFYAIPS